MPPAPHSEYRQLCRRTWASFCALGIVYQVFLMARVNFPAHLLLLISSGNVFSSKWTAACVRQRHHLLPPKPGRPQEFLPEGLICASPVWHAGRSQFRTRNACCHCVIWQPETSWQSFAETKGPEAWLSSECIGLSLRRTDEQNTLAKWTKINRSDKMLRYEKT